MPFEKWKYIESCTKQSSDNVRLAENLSKSRQIFKVENHNGKFEVSEFFEKMFKETL